jgi:glycine cleavage system aminomethyltransferase T
VALEEHVGKYRIHEDVPWFDASEALAALELWGPKAAAVLGLSALADGEGTPVTVGSASFAAVGTPFGAVLYVPAEAAEEVADTLVSRGAVVAEAPAIEARRIELGLGRFGLDWDETTNPLEAGLDRALNYKKGCYVGQ